MIDYPPRTQIVDYLRSVLYGPQGSDDETIQGTPFLRYMTGMLFPIGEVVKDGEESVTATADDEMPSPEIDDEEESGADGLELAFEALPAAVGLSFRVRDDAVITCKVSAARYIPVIEIGAELKKQGRAGKMWRREALATPEKPEVVRLDKKSNSIAVFSGLGRVVTRWRTRSDGSAVVTVTLVNAQKSRENKGLNPEITLFQVRLFCGVDDATILPYPEVGSEHRQGSEESEVAFLYKDSIPFARGHGAAATWGGLDGETCSWVATEFVPSVDVPAATFELRGANVDHRCTSIEFLVHGTRPEILKALDTLPHAYGAWIHGHRERPVSVKFAEVAQGFIDRAEVWRERMVRGIQLLRTDDQAWHAFQLANRAMAMQMLFARESKTGPFTLADKRRAPDLDFAALSWRPFQVAFMLSVLESVWNEKADHRDVVDVIWFPTGGGKTEAYLLVAALELIRRRLVHGERDTATAVMSRYTLRMLTAQQFQRTAALIAALELLRRKDTKTLGKRPFSLGLWVGLRLTPNTYRKAHELYTKQLDSAEPKNLFQLQACPCCATEIFPSQPKGKAGHWRTFEFGITADQDKFYFNCPNPTCEFHDRLPLSVVDEALYDHPPSMLIGTIDKFAMLPWDDRARVFFGGKGDVSPPPSLILQDELHLISGPLGSLAAPYEAAMDTIIGLRGGMPKRIASTATIRNAAEQVRGLYGRPVAVFPSPCGSWDDAFFFSTDETKSGRKYVGVMGQGYTKPVVAMAWTAAAILQSAKEIPLTGESLDGYWTLLAYHNSRRELGRTLTAARDEVATRIKTIASSPAVARDLGEPLELSAQMLSSMAEALDALNRPHTALRDAVDFVPCTSIISVGVDVDRLGVMLVNGQPKLTSEYIQATSRVGRAKIPGLVVTLFSPTKPRDRSHYEDFRAYHESIYKHVEPTSVTPYALPARLRTFHAALVSLVRHGLSWHRTEEAGLVDFSDVKTIVAIEQMLDVMCAADPTEASDLRELAAQRISEWTQYAEANGQLHYENRQTGTAFSALLYQYGHAPASSYWGTMMSVRNVDSEASISVE